MTNQLRQLIDETAAEIVKQVDNRLLTINKRQATEKLLEKFVRDIQALDDLGNQPQPKPGDAK